MKKLQLLIIIIVAIAGIFLFLSKKNEPTGKLEQVKRPEPVIFNIDADDGIAIFEIPDTALPAGMATDSISVVKEFISGDTSESGEFGAYTYLLEPEGTTLKESIRFKASFDNLDNRMPVIYTLSGDKDSKSEPVKDLVFTINRDTGMIDVEALIPRFKSITVDFRMRFFKITTEAAPAKVGKKIFSKAKISIDQIGDFSESGEDEKDIYKVSAGSVVVAGKITGHENLLPDITLYKRPPSTILTGAFAISGNEYTCEKPGGANITYHVTFKGKLELIDNDEENTNINNAPAVVQMGTVIIQSEFSCIDPLPEKTTATTTLPEILSSASTTPPQTTTFPEYEMIEDSGISDDF